MVLCMMPQCQTSAGCKCFSPFTVGRVSLLQGIEVNETAFQQSLDEVRRAWAVTDHDDLRGLLRAYLARIQEASDGD